MEGGGKKGEGGEEGEDEETAWVRIQLHTVPPFMAKPIAQFFLPTYCQQILSCFPHALTITLTPTIYACHDMHHIILLQTNI